jgi:cytochrome c oxidase cbb3-type subunit I/II
MYDPTSTSQGSLMPPYVHMYGNAIDTASTPAKIRAMQALGVPYAEGFDAVANADLRDQAEDIASNLKNDGIDADANKEIIALIAYLQRLGTDINKQAPATGVAAK